MPSDRILQRNDLTFPWRDERLVTVVTNLSEPGDGPHADNLLSNEDSYPRVAGALAARARPGGVYLGVGPDQNFTYIAALKPSLAFVIDYRRRNLLLHLLHKALFLLSADRRGYLERLTARRPQGIKADPSARDLVDAFSKVPFDRSLFDASAADVTSVLRPLGVVRDEEWPVISTIHARLAGPGMRARFLALPMYPTLAEFILKADRAGRPAHMLAGEGLYRQARGCQRGDRVIPLVGDFAGPVTLPRLGEWLRRRHFEVDVLYASDVEFFLLRSRKFADYVDNLNGLPWSDGAVIVRTSTREIVHPERVAGDSSTTVVRSAARFLADARKGAFRSPGDLFAADP